jgi:subtilisin family serine protease
VIIGVIDHGIDDTHPSLEDARFMDMPPPFWKRSCHPTMKCNKNLIGEKNMYVPYDDFNTLACDTEHSHGTHVTTTDVGNFVTNVSINGLASATASGVAPYSHLAIYKVCRKSGDCPDAAVLRAFDEAVADVVHVISLSLAASNIPTYGQSSIGISSFNAMQQGVHVVVCADNRGPAASSVLNADPWLLTVGTDTVDRYFPSTVYLFGPANDTHDPAVGEGLVDRMKLLTLPPPTFKPLLYRTEDHRGYCAYPFEFREDDCRAGP